jgi:hypothetical protein
MDANSAMFFFAGIAVSAVIFAVLIYYYPRLALRAPALGGPKPEIEPVLLPFLFYGISAAYRTAERAAADGYPPPAGAEKKRIADSTYDVLPRVGSLELAALKERIPPLKFQELLQAAFDEFDRFFKDNQSHFDRQYEDWKQAHPKVQQAEKPAGG